MLVRMQRSEQGSQIPFPGTIILSTLGMFLFLLPSHLQCSRKLLMTLNGPARLYRYAYNLILPQCDGATPPPPVEDDADDAVDDPVAKAIRLKDVRRHDDANGRLRYNLRPCRATATATP
ncbi:hypothetical protein KSP40_PGU012279 [Platanthera guangdongensis]|uniref:Uncharacterized protein n=1 Tax=Platanthera guangdongensis TaxID=2320717 RepID=A0ABR2MLI0_9ASPA